MLAKHLTVYAERISSSISSCITKEQLLCCHDMIDRFEEVFLHHPDRNKVFELALNLRTEYHEKDINMPPIYQGMSVAE
jgi:hypothetical protein